jgi:hypothetical protein
MGVLTHIDLANEECKMHRKDRGSCDRIPAAVRFLLLAPVLFVMARAIHTGLVSLETVLEDS